jgi:hypothetical protein
MLFEPSRSILFVVRSPDGASAWSGTDIANLERVARVQGVIPANAGTPYSSVRVRHADLSNN